MKIFDKNDSKEFLLVEYQECFNHMRHYDSIEVDFVKFSFSGYITLIAGSFALFQYLQENSYRSLYVGIILLLGFVGGLLLLGFVVRNRAYYVIVTKQVNSIRRYFLENSEIDFVKYNKCYLDSTKPRNFNPKSTHIFLMYLIIIFNNAILSGALFLISRTILSNIMKCIYCIIAFLVISASIFLQYKLSRDYLKKRDKKSADEAIFG